MRTNRFTAISAAIILLTAFQTRPIIAQEADDHKPPSDCFFTCKAQFRLFTKKGSSGGGTKKLNKLFGAEPSVVKGKNFTFTAYTGIKFDYISIESAAGKNWGKAVFAMTGNASYAPIPLLHNGTMTLGDMTLNDLQESCRGGADAVESSDIIGLPDAKFAYFWSPICYFGRPGMYQNFMFLMEMRNCTVEPDNNRFSSLKCENDFRPTMVLLADSAENLSEISDAVARFVYWDEID